MENIRKKTICDICGSVRERKDMKEFVLPSADCSNLYHGNMCIDCFIWLQNGGLFSRKKGNNDTQL